MQADAGFRARSRPAAHRVPSGSHRGSAVGASWPCLGPRALLALSPPLAGRVHPLLPGQLAAFAGSGARARTSGAFPTRTLSNEHGAGLRGGRSVVEGRWLAPPVCACFVFMNAQHDPAEKEKAQQEDQDAETARRSQRSSRCGWRGLQVPMPTDVAAAPFRARGGMARARAWRTASRSGDRRATRAAAAEYAAANEGCFAATLSGMADRVEQVVRLTPWRHAP